MTRAYATLDQSTGYLDPSQANPAWTGGAGNQIAWMETPGGTVDGSNAAFTVAVAPSPSSALMLFKNGMLQKPGAGNDYTLSTLTVTFEAGNIPQTGDVLLATYPY